MTLFIDSLWRAAAYCLHVRVILYSLLPLALMVAIAFGAGWFFWEPAIDAVSALLGSWHLVHAAHDWLAGVGLGGLKSVLPPLLVLLLATPVIVVLSLLAVATMMTPAMVRLVASRRFATLEARHGGSFLYSVVGGFGATLLALLAIVVSMPLWLIPPLVLLLPPLIWGWLTYRVMSYDVLADHATRDERREVIRRHRPFLFAIGVITGYLGAAPSLVWASGWVFVAAAPVLIPVAIWIYTLVFAFSALWFAHYGLSALQALRAERAAVPVAAPALPVTEPGDGVTLPPLLPPL
jgi:hypothetical protein